MTDPTVWDLLFKEHQPMLSMAIKVIGDIPDAQFAEALRQLSHQESVMPLLDPTAWLSGQRYKNVEDYKTVIMELRRVACRVRGESAI